MQNFSAEVIINNIVLKIQTIEPNIYNTTTETVCACVFCNVLFVIGAAADKETKVC